VTDRQTDRQTDGQDVLCLYVVMCVGVKHVRRAATARTVLTSVNAQAVSATRRPASVCVKLADSDRTVVKVWHDELLTRRWWQWHIHCSRVCLFVTFFVANMKLWEAVALWSCTSILGRICPKSTTSVDQNVMNNVISNVIVVRSEWMRWCLSGGSTLQGAQMLIKQLERARRGCCATHYFACLLISFFLQLVTLYRGQSWYDICDIWSADVKRRVIWPTCLWLMRICATLHRVSTWSMGRWLPRDLSLSTQLRMWSSLRRVHLSTWLVWTHLQSR